MTFKSAAIKTKLHRGVVVVVKEVAKAAPPVGKNSGEKDDSKDV